MSPRSTQEQTKVIVQCLFEDAKSREEPDGVQEDSFDPACIAEKLRKLGDDYEEQVIQPLMKEIQKAAADKVQATFVTSVEQLCEQWLTESAEVAPEKLLLKASIMLGLYAKKNCPDLSALLQDAMTAFINARVASWVSRQGGWVGNSITVSQCISGPCDFGVKTQFWGRRSKVIRGPPRFFKL